MRVVGSTAFGELLAHPGGEISLSLLIYPRIDVETDHRRGGIFKIQKSLHKRFWLIETLHCGIIQDCL